jgi:hypothetical protein
MGVYNMTVIQLGKWRDDGLLSDDNEYLGELALNLAEQLDTGAGMAHAAVANQYRAAMGELKKAGTPDNDDDFDKFLSGLGTPGNPALGNASFS